MSEVDIDKEADKILEQINDEIALDAYLEIPSAPIGRIKPRENVTKDDPSLPVGFSKEKLSNLLDQINDSKATDKKGVNQIQDKATKKAISEIEKALRDSPKEDLKVNLTKNTVLLAIEKNRLYDLESSNKEEEKRSPKSEQQQDVTPKRPPAKNPNNLPEPKITENRNYDKKSPKAVLEELRGKSFAREIENDKEKSAVLINRAKEAEALLGADHPITRQEQMSADVYKRALALVGSGGLQIHGNFGEKQSAADNNLPVSSYLSHGARVMIEIPPGSGDALANWLTSGNPDKNGMSRKQGQQEAIDEGKIVYNRSAATHDVSIQEKVNKKGEKEFSLKEEKGFAIGLRDFVGNQFGMQTNHWGVDLAMNAEFNGKDSTGKIVGRPDGDHGHLYVHYVSPKADKPGSMLIGIEGGAPTSQKHSKTGASDPLSPVDSSKFDDLLVKKAIAGEKEYENTLVPKKYGGMVIKLDQEKLNDIVKINAKELSGGLAYVKPGTSPGDFKDKLDNKEYHQTPKFKESKKQEPTLEKPLIWKRITNIVTKVVTLGIIKPFQKEVNAYNAEHKSLKNQAKVQAKDGARISEQEKYTKTDIPSPDLTDKTMKRSNSIGLVTNTAISIGKNFSFGAEKKSRSYTSPPAVKSNVDKTRGR